MGAKFSFLAGYRYDTRIPEWRGGSIHRIAVSTPMASGHLHPELEINLVLSGRAVYLLGDRRYELRRNSLVWLFPEQDHMMIEASADYSMWLGLFRPELIAQACRSAEGAVLTQANPEGYFCRQLAEDAARSLEGVFAGVAGAADDRDRYYTGLGWALLSAWSAHRAAEDTAPDTELHPSVDKAVRLIRSNEAPESLEDLAREAHLSLSRLSRLFREQTGLSLIEFRNRQRLERFARIYGKGGGHSILEAALDAGFGSYPQFHRVFTEHMGCGPAEYRRRLRKQPHG
ncbi:hypothetical protein CCAX7_26390 [Capsulimonas corticalis]|uniref:Uncharacterized protein n=1 Tax=Capsulimonas corticalis TaxID=2219043 RepID=A0A402D6L9_9BACT|nr:AraC family transcriptional regulator [Capsulimonas corticalis]BDI30588.1 hypothetical protein CCAX7_26390 [Capsulimonas corticalis]